MLLAGPAVALVTLVTALLTTDAAGVPLRDPDHVAGRRLAWVVVLVVMLIVVDVVARAARRSDTLWPSLSALVSVRRDRWNRGRGVAVASALVSFYVTYLAYRNLKSVVPLLRPGELFDEELGDLDRSLFAGHDPAVLMHALLGTGVPTQILSSAYMFLFAFIPGSLALALVFSRDLQVGLYYTTAQSLNWVLGAASYFVLPSLGPIYVEPSAFANLPTSGVTHLQNYLLNQRLDFLHDPAAGGAAQSIAAFSSLHVSIFFTAAVAAHLLGLPRRVKTGAWILLGLTSAATIYFGWHYVLDDLGGLGIGAMALVLARALTGFDLRSARRASTPNPAPA